MELTVNGELREVAEGTTVAELLSELGLGRQGIARTQAAPQDLLLDGRRDAMGGRLPGQWLEQRGLMAGRRRGHGAALLTDSPIVGQYTTI